MSDKEQPGARSAGPRMLDWGIGIGAGVAAGIGFGAALGSVAVGIALGIAFGVVVTLYLDDVRKRRADRD